MTSPRLFLDVGLIQPQNKTLTLVFILSPIPKISSPLLRQYLVR